jgi:linoleoyl-CoA desaturase
MVQDEVAGRNLLARAYHRLHAKAGAVLLWAIASYWMLVVVTPWWWPLCLVSFVLAATGIAFNLMHDGNHQAFSRHRRLNWLAGLTLDLLGGSSLFWGQDHNKRHHDAPNVDPFDGDIQYGSVARVSPAQPWRPWFGAQQYYMWILYALIPQRWQFYLDFRKLLRPEAAHTLRHRLAQRSHWLMLAGKCVFVGWAFVIPALLHPWWCVLGVYLAGAALSGLLLGTVLQWAHCVEGARFTDASCPRDRLSESWLEVQVEATQDVRLPRWLSWYVGGLDHQIEHHLFPRYPHTVYRRIAPSIEHFCRRNQLAYRSHANLGVALRAHFRWLRAMGARPETVAPLATAGDPVSAVGSSSRWGPLGRS